MTKFHEMTYREFSDAVKASAGMNRWPQLGQAQDVVSYSVYMNGDIADSIPQAVREQEFRDVALHALTEKLGLNPLSMRDNLKVAEVLGVSHAYMYSVLEASMGFQLSPEVQKDYELLSNPMAHPLIKEAIDQQKLLSQLLMPALADAEKALGHTVTERAATGVSRGEVISQNGGFTVVDMGDGSIVAHENGRLASLPAMNTGKDVTVAYYRGKGQVIENIQEMGFGQVYVDQKTGDLAVELADSNGVVEHVVMFNSIAMVAEFATEHELEKDFVRKAMEAREAMPKQVPDRAQRTIVGDPYLDAETQSLAVDYREGPIRYTAVFRSAQEFDASAMQFGATEAVVSRAYQVESLIEQHGAANEKASFIEAWDIARQKANIADRPGEIKKADINKVGRSAGVVIGTTALHVVQDTGLNSFVVHDKRNLDKVPLDKEKISIAYKGGRGEVTVREPSKERGGR